MTISKQNAVKKAARKTAKAVSPAAKKADGESAVLENLAAMPATDWFSWCVATHTRAQMAAMTTFVRGPMTPSQSGWTALAGARANLAPPPKSGRFAGPKGSRSSGKGSAPGRSSRWTRSVARNDATRSCGSFRMKPTVSVTRLSAPETVDRKAAARTAGEAMTAPAVTIGADRRVDAAAATMLDRSVNRLPVIDREGLLVGIVTRADLVRAFVHTDDQIEREIREEVLLHELWLDPEEYSLSIQSGEVTVSGPARTEAERDLLVRRISLVPGVVSVSMKEVAHP